MSNGRTQAPLEANYRPYSYPKHVIVVIIYVTISQTIFNLFPDIAAPVCKVAIEFSVCVFEHQDFRLENLSYCVYWIRFFCVCKIEMRTLAGANNTPLPKRLSLHSNPDPRA